MKRIGTFPAMGKSDKTMFSCCEQLKVQKGLIALLALEPSPPQAEYEEVKEIGNRISEMLDKTGLNVSDPQYMEKEEEIMQKLALERYPGSKFRREVVSDISTRIQAMIRAREMMTRALNQPECVTE